MGTERTDDDKQDEQAMLEARRSWWGAISRRGDPQYLTNAWDAFRDGFTAAISARSASVPSGVIEAVNDLLDAEDMHLHNEAIFKGKWKKGSKAWSGAFIESKVNGAMVKLRAILRPAPAERAIGDGVPPERTE